MRPLTSWRVQSSYIDVLYEANCGDWIGGNSKERLEVTRGNVRGTMVKAETRAHDGTPPPIEATWKLVRQLDVF